MKVSDITACLDSFAPPAYQQDYDNAGLITGIGEWECSGVLTTLDVTESVVLEAVSRKVNLVVAHHPVIFRGLRRINGKGYVEKAIIAAIKNDIAIYASHTNLDAVAGGVNGRIADKIGLIGRRILAPESSLLRKLFTFVPPDHADAVRNALFEAGAGHIGNYSETSFNSEGFGTYLPGEGTQPFLGQQGLRQKENELKLEVIFPAYLQQELVRALVRSHPYEEVAYDIMSLSNEHGSVGSGLVGELPEPVSETGFLESLKEVFGLQVIRHTRLRQTLVRRVALCGGAGSFLIPNALAEGADFYVSADIKYHEFFEANDRIVLADIGHHESEQFTPDLLADQLRKKFPTFAILKSGTVTNPVHYYL